MTLPPLPLIDGAFFIDNSFLEAFQTCPRYAQHSRLNKRVLAAEKLSLNFGKTMHAALEWRYKTIKSEVPDDITNEMMGLFFDEMYKDVPVLEDDHRDLNLALEIVRHYNEKYRREPFNILVDKDDKPMVEMAFVLPLYKAYPQLSSSQQLSEVPVYYCGRIDLPVEWDKQLIVMDHKTDSMFWGADSFLAEQRPSNQYRGYCWAFEQLTGKVVDGFCVNGIRTKAPPKTKPRNMTIDQWWEESFVRDITYLALYPNWQDKWKNDTIELVEQFFWQYSRGRLPMFGKFTRACSRYGGCPFKDVCLAPTEEKGIETLLDDNIYKDNDWSPLEKVKTI